MISPFPFFKKISLDDELDIKSYTNKYKPYSDFNFTNLWSWDDERQFSDLNGNLIVYFTDYESGEPFLSFLGENKVDETASTLIDYAKEKGLPPTLDLVGEESIKNINQDKFFVEPSNGNFDYIFDISKLAFLQGKSFKAKKRSSVNFLANNEVSFDCVPLKKQYCVDDLLSVILKWKHNKIKEGKSYCKQEELSLKKLFAATVTNDQLLLSTVLVDNNIVGFSVDEVLVDGYAISHFIKADVSYKGIYEFMNEKIAEKLHERGIVYWNWEQDLGVECLKLNKLSYHPVDLLKKYKITLR